MNGGMALLAQTTSIRGFRDCEYELAPFLILLAVLVVFTFAGDRIARLWKEKVAVKGRKCRIAAAIVAAVVIAAAVIIVLTQVRQDVPKVGAARTVSAPP
jgi:uncharacterized membrane protein